LQERIETVGDDADLQEVYDPQRHLMYVACTRARDHLPILKPLLFKMHAAASIAEDISRLGRI
jgi:hypothetical protein